jgi:hypothetical protein
MSWFFKPKQNEKTLGTTLGSQESIQAEIDKMQGSIVKTSKTYQDNIKKYKEIARLNQQLTKSYVANLKVITDVSELLNSYTNVFASLKTEFGKMEDALGKPLDISDFEYLQSLTRSKIDSLNTEFIKQTDGLKKLYAQYGKAEELNRIIVAQGDIQKVITNSTQSYKDIDAQFQKGGKKERKPKRKTGHRKGTVRKPKQT